MNVRNEKEIEDLLGKHKSVFEKNIYYQSSAIIVGSTFGR
jgi:hypothetical protein